MRNSTQKTKIAYYISTGLFSLLMTFGAMMYIVNYAEVSEKFLALGYPTHIVYPLAIAKLLGLVAIWSRKSTLLKDLAYAGFFYDLILATMAHLAVQDGEFAPAAVALVFAIVSYTTQRLTYYRNTSAQPNDAQPLTAAIETA